MKQFLRSVFSSAFALTMALLPAPASAKLTWVSEATPGAVTSVGVAPNDIPFISTTDGKVWYLARGKGACPPWRPVLPWNRDSGSKEPRICLDKWIEIPGINTQRVIVTTDGMPMAIDAASGKVFDALGKNTTAANWVPEVWQQVKAWRPGCVTSVVSTGVKWGGPLAFLTPLHKSDDWERDLYAVGCSSENDTSLWVLRRWVENGVTKSAPWRQLAVRQGATSQKVALFTTFPPAGPNEEVWFLDSYESGGGVWMYDKAKDVVVEKPRPSRSTKPNPPRVRGTTITDHHARFTVGDSPKGYIYRWNDDTSRWSFVIEDPADAQIENLAYAPEYESSGGVFGPSSLWASDAAGTLYVMRDLTEPK